MDGKSKTIVIERVFNAPVEKVWKAWTEPEKVKKWWGPKDFTAPHVKIDLRVGGKFLGAMHGPPGSEWDKDLWSTGTYKEIIPLKKIVSTDSFADEQGNIVPGSAYGMPENFPEELLVTVTFEDLGDKTKIILRHEGFPLEGDIGAEEGWNQSLDKFAKVVEEK